MNFLSLCYKNYKTLFLFLQCNGLIKVSLNYILFELIYYSFKQGIQFFSKYQNYKIPIIISCKPTNIQFQNSKSFIKSQRISYMLFKNSLKMKKIALLKNFNKATFSFSAQKILKVPSETQSTQKVSTINKIQQIPSLKQFITIHQNNQSHNKIQGQEEQHIPLDNDNIFRQSYEALNNHLEVDQSAQASVVQQNKPLKFHIETYGCQMNVNDSEIIRSILKSSATVKFEQNQTQIAQDANVVFLNTCAIRQSAQSKIHTRIKQLKNIKSIKILGLLGCMAQRLKDKMFESGINIICGPDAYRDLPKLIQTSLNSSKNEKNQMNVQLSVEETYADITPVRKNPNAISAFLSIMRGCNNMCSFCIVPFVRGRQRSRDVQTILKEIQQLQNQGVKQVTLLGQNVNSYHDTSKIDAAAQHQNSQGFGQTFKLRNIPGYRFAQLLEIAAKSFPDIRFRFTSPHPKDFPDQVLQKIAEYPNLCNYIHLPAQSGNTQMLFKMRRNHTRQAYINLANRMRAMISGLTLSTDLICGFCGQTQQQFQDTLSLLQTIKYQNAFLFAYSMRQRTHAHRRYVDDVPLQVKKNRLKKMIDLFTQIQKPLNDKQLNKNHLVLVQNTAKRQSDKWIGKTDNFKKAVIQKGKIPYIKNGQFAGYKQVQVGDFVAVKVQSVAPRILNCEATAVIEKLSDYAKYQSKIINFNQKLQTIAA